MAKLHTLPDKLNRLYNVKRPIYKAQEEAAQGIQRLSDEILK